MEGHLHVGVGGGDKTALLHSLLCAEGAVAKGQGLHGHDKGDGNAVRPGSILEVAVRSPKATLWSSDSLEGTHKKFTKTHYPQGYISLQ